jgi:hypothetical protein
VILASRWARVASVVNGSSMARAIYSPPSAAEGGAGDEENPWAARIVGIDEGAAHGVERLLRSSWCAD